MNAPIESLGLVHQACWLELQHAARQRGHPFRLMALGTVADAAGGAEAEVRHVVVREVHPETKSLVFFTDARSPKVAQMRAHPRGTLLAWSERLGWQLRLRVALTVETEGLGVSSRWARLKMSPAAHDYLSPLPPGTPVVERFVPERATREHFSVVTARIEAFDWLELHADGHRRAHFDADGNGQWLVP
ncbi:MAG TPA: pyridoxamine 5'-phosphate oxidase family protein [Aquabacterium sp.]|nr:pyridoxamine 5'-phosphate oxidase family protein [Aquabacterium sp.]